ncbi:MAG: class I SAM-dependent methyltransferase [Chloroflexi bacterium]|nr:class I SAM-dependent methyltransferase [Chloroflexota bacterium]
MEVDCLWPFLHRHERPYLEIGVGSGRFAQALGIEYGLDPALALLRMARSRGIEVFKAIGEELPFRGRIFGGIVIALTLCFVRDPQKVLQEAWRVLQPGGGLVVGLIPKGSAWAEFYTGKGRKGHPLYSTATFFSRDEVECLLRLIGFGRLDCRSVLFQPPGQSCYSPEHSVAGYRESAGFVAIGGRKQEV